LVSLELDKVMLCASPWAEWARRLYGAARETDQIDRGSIEEGARAGSNARRSAAALTQIRLTNKLHLSFRSVSIRFAERFVLLAEDNAAGYAATALKLVLLGLIPKEKLMKRMSLLSTSMLAAAAMIATAGHTVYASDHDDGETDLKSRALNLSDHFAFRSPTDPTKLDLVMYFNPRSLPGRQYTMSTKARYEFHVSKAATKTTAPTMADDYVFRFEAADDDGTGVQNVTLTAFVNGTQSGTLAGKTTTIAASKAGTLTTNTGKAGAIDAKFFIGPRADSFHFDVVRFFQVRAFLAQRFFGGPGGIGDATATLAPNCRGDAFLGAEGPGGADNDKVNLFNPPSCAPDFTKDLNVTAIVLEVPISELGGGTVFDTWSIVSVAE
jgi:hypothetical protein